MQNDSVDIKKEIISEERLKRELIKKISAYSVFFFAGLLTAFLVALVTDVTILAVGIVAAACTAFMGFCSVYEKILDRRIKKVEALIKEDKQYNERRKRFRVINGNGK